MHLHVIICFAVVIWWPVERLFPAVVTSPIWTAVAVWAQVPLIWLAASWTSRVALGRLDGGAGSQRAQHFYHRSTTVLRMVALVGFMASLLLTKWVEAVHSIEVISAVPGMAGLVILLPFFIAVVAIFVGSYPIDRAIHQIILDTRTGEGGPTVSAWSLPQYLSFNLRHHLLVIAVPMLLIVAAFDLAQAYWQPINRFCRVQWAAEVAPAAAAGLIFVFAPAMLRYIWPTKRLPDGDLRRRLESMCQQIGFRYREILVWQSGGMMVNAAVMGLFRQVRYVMLSDGLLEAMSRDQIEAVFGHEVGHVRHHHIPYFLLFAVCSMLVLSGIVELLRLGVEGGLFVMSVATIQVIGFGCVLVLWGVAFGWVSRRFEWQADLFGTRCVTPNDAEGCKLPCNAHSGDRSELRSANAVCATAVGVFTSALDRVAVLNGIPRDERSWRHGSIAERVWFLTSLSGDPTEARRFRRVIGRIKVALLVLAIGGSAFAGIYVWDHPIYGIGVGVEPVRQSAVTRQFAEPSPRAKADVRTDH